VELLGKAGDGSGGTGVSGGDRVEMRRKAGDGSGVLGRAEVRTPHSGNAGGDRGGETGANVREDDA
jgi:hypothetical protein